MKIKIEENSIDLNDVKAKLDQNFPDYKTSFRNKFILNVAQTKTVGAVVMVRKKSLIVTGNFPSMNSQIIFTLCVVLLGFIIPLIIYFAVFHKKMKAVEKEIADFLKKEYNLS